MIRQTSVLHEQVHLRPLKLEHAKAMFTWMQDPMVSENIGLKIEPSLEKTVEWIRRTQDDDLTQPFAVLLGQQHVGNVVLDKIDSYLKTARFSIYIGERQIHGQGIGQTASYLALREGFQGMGLYKVWLTVHSRHYKAINLYSRLGFSLEGILREEFLFHGERIDLFYMGLLSNEFMTLYSDK